MNYPRISHKLFKFLKVFTNRRAVDIPSFTTKLRINDSIYQILIDLRNLNYESTLKSGILGSRSNFAEYFFIQNYSYPVLPQIPIEVRKTEKSSQRTKN